MSIWVIVTSFILLCFHFGVHSGDHYLYFGVTRVIILSLASFIYPSLICKDESRLGEVRLNVQGERSGKGARVSAGFWGGLGRRSGWGSPQRGVEGRPETQFSWTAIIILSFVFIVVYRVLYRFLIILLSLFFSSFPELLRISETIFLSFPEWSGFRRSFFIIPRRVEDLGIIPFSLPEWSRIRDIEHTGGKDIWPDLLHHKQHNIYDSRIRRFEGSKSKTVNVGWPASPHPAHKSKRSIEGFPNPGRRVECKIEESAKSRLQIKMQDRRIFEIQATVQMQDRRISQILQGMIKIVCLHLSTCGTKNLVMLSRIRL